MDSDWMTKIERIEIAGRNKKNKENKKKTNNTELKTDINDV